MNKDRFRITVSKVIIQTLDEYCKLENRDRSNMIEKMIVFYDKITKDKRKYDIMNNNKNI